MQYMLLLYANETAGQALPASEMAAWMEKMHAYKAALDKAGAHVAHGALGPTAAATTVHLDTNRKLHVHAGPYAETQEQLGGYYLIEAGSMAEAQQWAAKCPAAIWGHIEIRQIQAE
jgi:hypothetical protein